MKPQIAFERRAFELPLPRAEAGRDGQRDGYRRPNEIEIANCGQDRFLAPDRKDVEDNACNEEGNRKMNNHRMLGVPCEERRLQIERI
jgi:hypothetical protein